MKKTIIFIAGIFTLFLFISCNNGNVDKENEKKKDETKYYNDEWACKPTYDIFFKLDDVLCSYFTGPVQYVPGYIKNDEEAGYVNLGSADFDEAYFDDSHTKIFDYSNIDYEKWGNYFDKTKTEHTISTPIIAFYFSDENLNLLIDDKFENFADDTTTYRKNVPFFDIYKSGGINYKKCTVMEKLTNSDFPYKRYYDENGYYNRYDDYKLVNRIFKFSGQEKAYFEKPQFCYILIKPELKWNEITNLSEEDNSSVHVKFRYWKNNEYNNDQEIEYDFNFSEMFKEVLTNENYNFYDGECIRFITYKWN